MNGWCAATYAQFFYAECEFPQLMRAALTSAGNSRPMCDSENFEACELSECVQRITVKELEERAQALLPEKKLRGQTVSFARGLAAQARPS